MSGGRFVAAGRSKTSDYALFLFLGVIKVPDD